MFVTNLINGPLGVDGIINLRPLEENRFIEETPDLVERVKRLQVAGKVIVSFDEGLTKPDPEQVVESEVTTEPVEDQAIVETPEIAESTATTQKGGVKGGRRSKISG